MDTSFQKTKASDEWFSPKELVEALGERNVKALEESGLTGFLMKRNCEWKNI